MRTDTIVRTVPQTPTVPVGPAPRVLRRRTSIRPVLRHVVLITSAAAMIYPLVWMLVSSLRPTSEIFRTPGLWLDTLFFDNYIEGWSALSEPFGQYLINSTVIVLGSIIGNLVSCSLAAYAFARLEFRGKRLLFAGVLFTILLPFHVTVIPQYIMFSQIGWVNTFWPLIVPKLLATDGFFIFLLVQFIRGLPRELDEAARIDGCGHPRIFFSILLPLMVPALATTAIFTFIWTWNDFFSQLIYLTNPELYTASIALRTFLDSGGQSNWGGMFAMSVLSLTPLFLVFLFGQRFLIQGIATTGIK